MRSAPSAWAFAIVASALVGCPTTPPRLRGPSPELGSETTGTSTTDDADPTGSDAAMSSDGGASGEWTDDAGADMGGGISEPSCWSSPADCSVPSEHTGPGECDPYAQDCPPGEKCMPIASDGQWTSTACRPVADAPAAVAEPCTIEGASGSGLDDCDVGLICRSSDGGLSGRCRELCGCGPADPTCGAPGMLCVRSGDLFGLCLPSCDPLLQDCVAPDGCYFTGEIGFVCTPAASAQPTVAGDPCESATGCSPGQMCIGAESIAGCTGQVGCCAEVCGVDGQIDGEPACALAELQCAPLWGGSTPAPDCPADLGVCVHVPR